MIHNDPGKPGNEIKEDVNCNAIEVWESYNRATGRIQNYLVNQLPVIL